MARLSIPRASFLMTRHRVVVQRDVDPRGMLLPTLNPVRMLSPCVAEFWTRSDGLRSERAIFPHGSSSSPLANQVWGGLTSLDQLWPGRLVTVRSRGRFAGRGCLGSVVAAARPGWRIREGQCNCS